MRHYFFVMFKMHYCGSQTWKYLWKWTETCFKMDLQCCIRRLEQPCWMGGKAIYWSSLNNGYPFLFSFSLRKILAYLKDEIIDSIYNELIEILVYAENRYPNILGESRWVDASYYLVVLFCNSYKSSFYSTLGRIHELWWGFTLSLLN